jgi:hypothetical protein
VPRSSVMHYPKKEIRDIPSRQKARNMSQRIGAQWTISYIQMPTGGDYNRPPPSHWALTDL